jgi:CBS domain containing-hemolysin-like protein
MNTRALRRRFFSCLALQLRVVWPIISGLIAVMVILGVIIGFIEDWRLQDSLYFSFVTGLTIGFGDLVPKTLLTRALAMVIGATGILLTATLAAVAVKALDRAQEPDSPA